MLRKFKVSNFKCFEKDFELDLTKTKGYEFNKECIKHNTVNSAIIYGYNAMGKSNLALAIFDIIEHLTDKNKNPTVYKNYLCANSSESYASFYFEFYINSKIVVYEYMKKDYETIVYEKFSIDNELLFHIDRREGDNTATINIEGAELLRTDGINSQLSILKYTKNNTVLIRNDINDTFMEFFDYVESMLFFRSLEDRTYIGFRNDAKNLTDEIIEKDKVKDFEEFLNSINIECNLDVVENIDGKTLVFKIGEKNLSFFDIISTGTSSVTLFYYWYISILEGDIKFIFIDEFDAFYHQTLSEAIVKRLISSGVQFILTSHNTSNLTNDLLRPDCYFVMNKKTAKSLSSLTQKELREAHNIEKMYKSGAFDVE